MEQSHGVEKYMKSQLTTLCYIEKDNSYLMLHRIKKESDINRDKWIGIGGHFEYGESPEECLLREVKEETGLTLTQYRFRGIVTFVTTDGIAEYMCLYTADAFTGTLPECDEGVLEWVPKERFITMNLWEGDYIFLKLLEDDAPFFSLKLVYEKDRMVQAVLDGKPMELFDICDENGNPTGLIRERSVAHRYGGLHRTSHVWIVKRQGNQYFVLLQKRSHQKDSYPDCYDISSAGHIPAGVDFLESALRELKEELEIEAEPEELHFVGRRKKAAREVFYGKPFIDEQVMNVYVLCRDIEEKDLTLQKEEIESVCFVEVEECMERIRHNSIKHCIYEDEFEMVLNWCRKEK